MSEENNSDLFRIRRMYLVSNRVITAILLFHSIFSPLHSIRFDAGQLAKVSVASLPALVVAAIVPFETVGNRCSFCATNRLARCPQIVFIIFSSLSPSPLSASPPTTFRCVILRQQ